VILLSRPFRADSRLSPTQGVALGWYVMPLRGCKPSAPNQMAGVMIKAFISVKIFTLTYLEGNFAWKLRRYVFLAPRGRLLIQRLMR
jgi:hypothetical protein